MRSAGSPKAVAVRARRPTDASVLSSAGRNVTDSAAFDINRSTVGLRRVILLGRLLGAFRWGVRGLPVGRHEENRIASTRRFLSGC